MFSSFWFQKCYSCISFLMIILKKRKVKYTVKYAIIKLVIKTILIRSYACGKLCFNYTCNCSENKIDLAFQKKIRKFSQLTQVELPLWIIFYQCIKIVTD